jgi:hypothetical protein
VNQLGLSRLAAMEEEDEQKDIGGRIKNAFGPRHRLG